MQNKNWTGRTYGGGRLHNYLTKVLKFMNVRILYIFAFIFIVPVVFIINSQSRHAVYKFYRIRLRHSRMRSSWMTFRNFCSFAQVVIDRFAMYAGKSFRFEVDGYEYFSSLDSLPGSFVILSAHIGNFELAGYSLVSERKRFNVVLFAGEKESVMKNRQAMFENTNVRMIPMRADMEYLFTINAAMGEGEIVSLPADRFFGGQKSFSVLFFGENANFPQGPFVVASRYCAPVLFVAVMKTGAKKYKIYVRPLSDSNRAGNCKDSSLQIAESFSKVLEETVRQYPLQWYNYYDFWKK